MIALSKQLGKGIYTPAEAAFYARVRPRTLARWVFGDRRGEAVIRAEVPAAGPEKIVTFLDFVQTMAVRSIRTQFAEVSLQKIRTAVEFARSEFGIDFPFARPHATYVIREGSQAGEVVISIAGRKLVQLTGRQKRQLLMTRIAELYLDNIAFEDGIAAEYTAWKSDAGAIVINPHFRFGEPLLQECGYTAQTLWDAVHCEGGIEEAAAAYGVAEDQVKLACTYIDHLVSAAV